MASPLSTSDEQGPQLFEDLDVYFSQEECVSLPPAQKTNSREAPLECFEDLDLIGGEDKTEPSQQLSLESMEPGELSLDTHSTAAPLVHSSEKSEDDVGTHERKMSGGTLTCKTKVISLLVTIENQTPLVELSQCLGVRALSDIIEVPWEEAKNVYKCPDCDQSFSDNTYLVLHQKIHSREKRYKCNTCEKTFSHRTNLRTHKRIHTGEKPYKCTKCAASFRQQSHLSRHMNSHIKEKPYTCNVCGKGFMWLPGLAEHQKSHADKKSYECADRDQHYCQETNLALPEKTGSSDTPFQHAQCVKSLEQPSYPALPEKDHKEDSKNCSIDDEDFFSFSRFKPLQCLDCDMTFPCFSELVSHQTIHDMEKPHKCKTCAKTFALESELASHEKNHIKEEPFKCTVCGKSFRVNMHLITHKRTHRRNTK
uniref:Zinc finger protein 597 n=1 Tax=Peromyscus maniculatus bairdii TaxID=230844 RepID=A0A6I9LL85_PERMB|nr:zinc finger protein 597 isoform X1 [Peromyscus maniculatus bairdii]